MPIAAASGFALEMRRARFVCGATFRLGAPRADGSLDTRGYKGGTADMIRHSLRLQAPWLAAARGARRETARMPGATGWVSGTTQLMRAAAAGDERRVRELLAAGAAPGASRGGRTALHWASAEGHEGVVRALLAADAEAAAAAEEGEGAGAGAAPGTALAVIDATTRANRSTALMLASAHGHEGAVRALLARGACQLRASVFGGTALHFAAREGHADVAALLCAAPGAARALEARCENGRTPLGCAVHHGRAVCEAALRALGASE